MRVTRFAAEPPGIRVNLVRLPSPAAPLSYSLSATLTRLNSPSADAAGD